MKRFAVIGLSTFGQELAINLYKLGNEVTVLDRSKEKIQTVSKLVSTAIVVDIKSKDSLKALELEHMDGIIVSTGTLANTSILVTLFLKELGAKNIIVKTMDDDHAKILKRVGADQVVNPEMDMAQNLAAKLNAPNFLEFVRLSDDYNIVEIAAPYEFHGKSLGQLEMRKRYNVTVIGVRDVITEKFTVTPGPDYIVKDSEVLIVIGTEADLGRLKSEK